MALALRGCSWLELPTSHLLKPEYVPGRLEVQGVAYPSHGRASDFIHLGKSSTSLAVPLRPTLCYGGSHECNGLNLNVNPKPGGTCTTALDDAAHLAHFSFDGTFSTEFDDFFITSIGGDTQTDTQFWGLLLNFQFTPVGGCQQEVKFEDDVLWAFDAFNAKAFLKLVGPVTAKTNEAVVLTVTDGSSGNPIEGATVNGKITDSDGHVTLIFTSPGVKALKAEKESTIRSNRLNIVVI